jgi:hypothetical protein
MEKNKEERKGGHDVVSDVTLAVVVVRFVLSYR